MIARAEKGYDQTEASADQAQASLHVPGAKDDDSKPLPALVLGGFARALNWVVAVGTFGAKKYSPRGWAKVANGEERYLEAAMRHVMAYLEGEKDDPESGLPHLAHAIWNFLAVCQIQARGKP